MRENTGTFTALMSQQRIDEITWYHDVDFPGGLQARTKSEDAGSHHRLWEWMDTGAFTPKSSRLLTPRPLLRASGQGLRKMLEANYFRVLSESIFHGDSKQPVRRVLLSCQPFTGENLLHCTRPPFGLHRYDRRYT